MTDWRDRFGFKGARGLGVRGFLRWWGGALATWVPARWRGPLGLARDRLLLSPDGGEASLLRQVHDGTAELATLPLPLAAVDLERLLPPSLASLPRWLLLPAAQVLRRPLSLPAAAADRLRDVVGFEIDRQTPFTAAQVHFDVRVLGRHGDRLEAELVAVPRATVERALAKLGAVSASLVGADVPAADGGMLGVNLLPPDARRSREDPMRHWNRILAACTVLALAAAGGQLLHNRRAAADALARSIDAEAGDARRVAVQRQQLVDLVEGQAFLERKRASRPAAIEVLDEITRRLPDNSYLEKLSIQGDQLSMIGFSADAPALVGQFEGAPIWSKPALIGALQPDPATRRDRFSLAATLTAPAAVPTPSAAARPAQ
ncbi:MAG: type II secretion system protein GspL [Pseudoxanthomonas sp.]